MKKFLFLPLVLILFTVSCTPVEKVAYKTIVASKAFLDAEKKIHTECPNAATAVCQSLTRATAAKDLLIDATEVYCSGSQFESGGVCQPPAKGTPAFVQAEAKLKAAIEAYQQSEKDLKGVL